MSVVIKQDISGNTAEPALHIGEELRLLRVSKDISLDDVSQALHISVPYLSAIERLDQDALPSQGYVLGFMRTYAKFLGLDPREAAQRYKEESALPDTLSVRDCPHFVEPRRIHLPNGSIAAGLLVSCFAVLAMWYGMSTDAQSAQILNASRPAQVDLGFAKPQPTLGDEDVITLKANGPSWIEIKDMKGQTIASRIFVSGEIFETRKDVGLVANIRDGGVIEFYRGGVLFGPIGNKGERVMGLALK